MSADLRRLATTVDLAPRRRPGRRLALLVAVAVVLGAAAARNADQDVPPAAAEEVAAPALAAPAEPDAVAEPAPAPEPDVRLPLLGRVGDLQLHVPAEEAVLVSYHEAAYIEAMPIVAIGTLLGNENPTRELLQEPGGPDDAVVPFHVQVSRGRANGSTSAVDVVLDPSQQVRAPVAGTVVEVRPYLLYGSHEDVRIELRPDGAPDRAVVLIHVEEPAVRAGDHVDVGDVLAARARAFPFSAVVDRQTAPERYGHVHIEVKLPQEDG